MKLYLELHGYLHIYSKTIDSNEIYNVLESSFSDQICGILNYYDVSVLGATSDNIAKKFTEYGIKHLDNSRSEQKEYRPFSDGCIHQEDFEYIKATGLPIDECVKYADGWYSCLPYLDVFELFDADGIKHDYLHLLHTAIFARVIDKKYIANWYKLIGNILCLLDTYGGTIDWKKLYDIFIYFLDVSLIYHPIANED